MPLLHDAARMDESDDRRMQRGATDAPGSAPRGSALRVAGAVAAFAALHSLLASRRAKGAASRVAGERARAGWYRVLFNAQAVAAFAALAVHARRLPDRTLYRATGALAGVLRTGQLAGLAVAALAVREVGLGRMAGTASLAAWARGARVVPPEPEAQGPAHDAGGMRASGPFAWTRHPLNLAPLPVLWLHPHMTANLATFNLAATLYLVLGSRHEERRLLAAHGADYAAYRRSGVPFYWPRRPALPPATAG